MENQCNPRNFVMTRQYPCSHETSSDAHTRHPESLQKSDGLHANNQHCACTTAHTVQPSNHASDLRVTSV
eukprot:5002570-Prymnesium_polylepis.1